jgi:O-antigen ligase
MEMKLARRGHAAEERLTFSFRDTVPSRAVPASEMTFATAPHSEPRDWGYTGLLAFTVVLFARPQEQLPALAALPLAEICAILGILPMLIHRMIRRLPIFRVTPETIGLAVFAFAMLATIPFSIWPGGALRVFLDLFLKVVIVFALMMNTLTTTKRIELFSRVILVCWGFIAANGLFDYARGVNLWEGGRLGGPPNGLFSNPNDLALCMVVFMPIAIVGALTSRNSILWRAIAAVIVVLMAAVVVLTKSRGGALGLVVVVAAMVVLTCRVRPAFAIMVLGGTLLATPFMPASFWTRMTSIFDSEVDAREFTGSRETRWTVMKEGIQTFLERPLTGVGAGQFRNYNFPGRQERWRRSHNALIEVASEIGIVGLLAFVFLIVRAGIAARALRRVLGHRSRRETALDRALSADERQMLHGHATAMSAALLGWFTCALFASVAYHWPFYYLLALTVAARELVRDRVAAVARVEAAPPPAPAPARRRVFGRHLEPETA